MLICTAADGVELHLLEEQHAEALAGLAEGYHARPQVNEWIFRGDTPKATREWVRGEPDRHGRGERVACGIWVKGRLAGVTVLDLRGGVLRQMVSYGGLFGDIAVHSLLRSEWEARGQR